MLNVNRSWNSVVAEYKFDAWGNIIAKTGLYYLMAGVNGRFIIRDAVQQINLYAYAANNTVYLLIRADMC